MISANPEQTLRFDGNIGQRYGAGLDLNLHDIATLMSPLAGR
jgi:hypothetical protein